MSACRHARFLILTLVLGIVFLPLPVVVFCGFPKSLKLEIAFPVDQRIELSELRARDRVRHR
uniref:Uncharacterized protein n=1 Tax=Nelumbo nucifera TaxID=4432 RepID=A0A822YAF1_NELNU|nr:TPA_asm: hypothetical protein HUJ06_029443 [Nelumbo nucifera]